MGYLQKIHDAAAYGGQIRCAIQYCKVFDQFLDTPLAITEIENLPAGFIQLHDAFWI